MRKKTILAIVVALVMTALVPTGAYAHPNEPGSPVGPAGGLFYAFDEAYKSTVTPAHVPNKGPFDTFYVFPNCASCAPVSDAAPGMPGYNGGRWKVVQAFGITTQLTSAADVEAQASSLVDTGHRFVCPLIKVN